MPEKLSDIRGDVKEIGWGNQIRSYVLQPYTMVKDHRTGEKPEMWTRLDGGLDPFISAYLRWLSLGCPDRKASAEGLDFLILLEKSRVYARKSWCASAFFCVISLHMSTNVHDRRTCKEETALYGRDFREDL